MMKLRSARSTFRAGRPLRARRGAWVGLAWVLFGCADQAIIRDFNDLPVAVAGVVDPATGGTVDTAPDGGLAFVTLPYSGSPVHVVLDARNSRDPDGQVVTYRWLSGTRTPDAGVPARLVPSGQPADWPLDEAMPAVDLGPGLWTFTLWVQDGRGAWSVPDTIRVMIGSTSPARPADAGATALGLTGMDAGVRLAVHGLEGDPR